MPILTSPFPTTHDTIGISALDSPPSSPPSVQSPRSVDNDEGKSYVNNDNHSARATSIDLAITELDKRLPQYTVDWNKLPGGGGHDNVQDAYEEDDAQPGFGGPEDFTFNIDKYLNDTMSPKDRTKELNDPDTDEEEDRLPDSPSPRPRHRHESHNHQEEAEESEFGPPVDMSTPSHLMWRKNFNSGKEETRLEDIEESFPSSPEKTDSPSKHDKRPSLEESRTFTTVLREIEDLHEQRRDRDEKIRENEKKLASANEEIESLREELQRKSSSLSEANAKLGEEDMLREQLRVLQEQNEEKAAGSENDAIELETLRKELADAREQLNKRDEALEDSGTKLRDLAASHELQLRQKNTEIQDLKAQLDEKELILADADEELAEVKGEYDTLKDRIESLETRNSPLEEKNILLEKELSSVRSELMLQKNAVSTLATDMSVDTEGKDYTEIITILKLHFKTGMDSNRGNSAELEELRSKLEKAQSALQQQISGKELAETEWKRSQDLLSESRSLITTIEGENTRLAARIQELNLSLSKAHDEINILKEDQQRRERERERERELVNNSQHISPSQTPTKTTSPDQIAALHESHRLEIKNLREIHTNTTNDLRTSYNDTIQHFQSMLSASEKRQTELQHQLLNTQSTTSAQTNEINALKTQIQQLQSTLALKEEASAEMDKVISRSIEKREREWERRTDLLLKERDKMGKALMWAWGEAEVGKTSSASSAAAGTHNARKGDTSAAATGGTGVSNNEKTNGKAKQGYRYKYVVRS